jgi:hypothetical protein
MLSTRLPWRHPRPRRGNSTNEILPQSPVNHKRTPVDLAPSVVDPWTAGDRCGEPWCSSPRLLSQPSRSSLWLGARAREGRERCVRVFSVGPGEDLLQAPLRTRAESGIIGIAPDMFPPFRRSMPFRGVSNSGQCEVAHRPTSHRLRVWWRLRECPVARLTLRKSRKLT